MTQVPVIYLATKFQAEVNSVEKKSSYEVDFSLYFLRGTIH